MRAKTIHTIYFDFGNVISLPSNGLLTAFLENTARNYSIPYSAIRQAYEKYRPWYDRDAWDPVHYWRMVLTEAGGSLENVDVPLLTREDDRCWSQINAKTLEWVRVLRNGGFRIGLLTNMPQRFYRSVVEPAPWLQLFDYKVVSGILGMVKPEEGIFRHAIELTGKPASGILYMDDVLTHVQAASRLGIQAYLFTDLKTASQYLCGLYDLPYPEDGETGPMP